MFELNELSALIELMGFAIHSLQVLHRGRGMSPGLLALPGKTEITI